MAELAPDFDCAAVDLPGSGFSPPPAAVAGYSVSALAGTVIRLIEALGGEPGRTAAVHLIGNSMGGAVAVRVAARRPDLVKTLTLVSPALPDLAARRSTAHFPVLALPVRRRAAGAPVGHRASRCRDRVAGVYRDLLSTTRRGFTPTGSRLEVEALRRRDALGYDAASLVGAARTLVAETLRPSPFSLWRAAARVTAPSLVLFGSDDRWSPEAGGARGPHLPGRPGAGTPGYGASRADGVPGLVAALFRELVDETPSPGADTGNAGRRDPVDAR